MCAAPLLSLFTPAKNLMQLFMWQRDIVGLAHDIRVLPGLLNALLDVPDEASTSLMSAQ